MTEQTLNRLDDTKNLARWIRVLVNSFAFAFIDTDYLNLAKAILPLIGPLLLISAQLFVNEMTPILNLGASISSGSWISKWIDCPHCPGNC